jgi:hypothetical protein
MDSKKHDENDPAADSKGTNEHAEHASEPVIESVARGIGTAMGVVASTAAKVMGKAESPEHETKSHETKSPEPKAKPRKSSKPRAAANEGSAKLSANRAAKKKKKRAAHRIKLKRSNTKG